jgi:hypothetical protein
VQLSALEDQVTVAGCPSVMGETATESTALGAKKLTVTVALEFRVAALQVTVYAIGPIVSSVTDCAPWRARFPPQPSPSAPCDAAQLVAFVATQVKPACCVTIELNELADNTTLGTV